MSNRRSIVWIGFVGLTLIGAVRSVQADPIFNPDNGHYYLQVFNPSVSVTWEQARSAAAALNFAGGTGYLATITSASEQAFIEANVQFAGVGFGIYIGGFQPDGSPEPDGGWQWITGEPFVYREPFDTNNAFGTENVIELSDTGRGRWNDITGTALRQSYLVEFTPVPEPSTASLLAVAGVIGGLWWASRQWATQGRSNLAL